MKKQSAIALALLGLMTTASACSDLLGGSSSRNTSTGHNTDTPSGSTRNVSGQFDRDAAPAALAALGIDKRVTAAPTESCPAANGPITVKAITGASGVAAVEDVVDSEGNFNVALDSNLTWYIQFFQGSGSSSLRCAELITGPAPADASAEEIAKQGKLTIIPKGSADVNLGKVVDLGDGKCAAQNEPALPSDLDKKDANGNRIYDEVEGVEVELGECDVIDIYPSSDPSDANDEGTLYVFPSDLPEDDGLIIGQIFFKTNAALNSSGLDGDGVRLYEEGDLAINGFDVESFGSTTEFLAEFAPPLGFLEFGSYRLELDAGTITCLNGSSNPTDIVVKFQPVLDSYYDEAFVEALKVQR